MELKEETPMNARYHVNPETGRAGKCYAKIKCRFGVPASLHFSTKEEAVSAYEKTMKKKVLPQIKKKASTLTDVTVSQFDPAEYTLFSNKNARTHGFVMGKALRRQFSNVKWLHELYEKNRSEISSLESQKNISEDDQDSLKFYKNHNKELSKEIPEKEARLMAMVKEMQWCADNNEAFQNSLTREQSTFLSKGFFRKIENSANTKIDGLVKKVAAA